MSQIPGTAALPFAERLDRLAEVAVRVGLGLRPGQELVMTAPLEAVPLARAITEHAYKAGASLVTTFYADDAATLARFAHAPDEAFDKAAGWLYSGMAEAYRNGAARLTISGDDPIPAGGSGSGQGRPRQPLALPGLCSRPGADRGVLDQLDHRLGGDQALGAHGLPGSARG